MMCGYKRAVWSRREKLTQLSSRLPLDIRPEFHKMFRICVKEEIESLHGNQGSTSMHGPANFESRSLKLRISNIIPQMLTGNLITGIGGMPVTVTLVDSRTNEEVKSGPEASGKVEIVVIGAEVDSVTRNDLERILVHHIEGNKSRCVSKLCLNLIEGTVVLPTVSFLHNKKWRKISIIRLQARFVDHFSGIKVKEAQTEPVILKDRRNEVYNKREIPILSDPVYRLSKISRRADINKRLCDANIKTVMDLLTLHAINPKRLNDILKVKPNTWKTIIDNAQKCKDDKGVYLYHHPRDGQKSHGVVFNIFGQLVGLVADSEFVPSDKLPIDKRVDAQQLVVSSSEHWEEVVSFNDQPSLISRLQSHTTLNSLHNNLNVVIPQTSNTRECDPTSLTSPQLTTPLFPTVWCANNKSNRGCDNAGAVGHNQSQSPKRSASEYAISNSPKKPRDDHRQISPSTPCIIPNTNVTGTLPQYQNTNNLFTSATTEDDNWLQYIDFSQCDISAQRWKRVWCVLGWISIYSKVRKRRMNFSDQLFETLYDETVFVISAPIQRAQT